MDRLLLSCSVVFLSAGVLRGAEVGAIRGRVSDESGAVVSGASIALHGPRVLTVASDAAGAFEFGSLPPGDYRLTVQHPGFATARHEALRVTAGSTLEASVTLAVALRDEQIVVSASKLESDLLDAPATISVITSRDIDIAPAENYGDLLRTVVGINVVQTSARDVNLTARDATSTVANSQLVAVDGRSVYLDFFGLVLWDLVPVNTDDIQQIEVLRGPASAVWGANAMTGVVNIITKAPRDAQGLNAMLSGGGFGRACDRCSRSEPGTAWDASLSFAAAPNDTWSYRLSAGYSSSAPYSRPTGSIPVIADPRIGGAVCDPTTGEGDCVGGAAYPKDEKPQGEAFGTSFENTATRQPRFDLRVEEELGAAGRLQYSAGYAATSGIVHTGIGPFDIQDGSSMSYGQLVYSKGAFRLSGFVNLVDVHAPNLISIDPKTGEPVQLDFKTVTFDLEANHSRVVRGRHLVSLGGNVRRNNFDITLAPATEDRTELGLYLQDQLSLRFARVVVGARLDKFGNLDHWVFSPRLALVVKPTATQSLRLSYNRAFRSASAINNYMDQSIVQPITLPGGATFPLPVRAVGSEIPIGEGERPALSEESLAAYEIAYTGSFHHRTTLCLAFYINDRDDSINFTRLSNDYDPYTAANPPPGWPLPAQALTLLAAQGVYLPRTAYTYMNLGPTRAKGFEASLDHSFSRRLSVSANYSWQGRPEVLTPHPGEERYPEGELGLPPTNRINLTASWTSDRILANVSLSHCDRTFWSDVLNAPYAGYTDSYDLLGATFGVRWARGKLTTSVRGTNLLAGEIQQHVFGDIQRRGVMVEARLRF